MRQNYMSKQKVSTLNLTGLNLMKAPKQHIQQEMWKIEK